jgi:uncharacterized protein YjbJ (UPF0337 family)
MSKLREKAQGRTKQAVGQMIGDEELVREGKAQEPNADREGEPKDGGRDRASNRRQ